MHNFADANWLIVALTVGAQLALFLRWLYRRIRNDEIAHTFVHDMATNHLPHIYERLEKLCEEQGIEHTPLPPIRWLDLNNRSRD